MDNDERREDSVFSGQQRVIIGPEDGSPAEWVWVDCCFPRPTRVGSGGRNGMVRWQTQGENEDEVLCTLRTGEYERLNRGD